jgi:hypothetical protein
MITKQQIEYLALYRDGWTLKQIAEKYGVNVSTVSRVIKRAVRKTCPFSPDCRNCPLPECAFKEDYMLLVNNSLDAGSLDKRRTMQYV